MFFKPSYKKFLAESLKRRETIVKLRNAGKTLEQIGASLGISRQRVSWILKQIASKSESL